MDVIILVQELEASWQWYPHGLAVGIGAAVCVVVGILLVFYFAPWVFLPIYSKFFKRWKR